MNEISSKVQKRKRKKRDLLLDLNPGTLNEISSKVEGKKKEKKKETCF